MSWRKTWKPVNTVLPIPNNGTSGSAYSTSKFNSWLPEVYQGPPDRLQRYVHYEQMDMDHEVSSALDCLAEFCTQPNQSNYTPFEFEFYETPSPTETEILVRTLKRWVKINEFNKRMFKIFRSTLMYGDQFLIRDPETYKLFWVDPHKIEKIIVDESEGKKIETYFIKDMDLNLQTLVASNTTTMNKSPWSSTTFLQNNTGYQRVAPAQSYVSSSSTNNNQSMEVDAKHVIHVTMTDGLDNAWPFGVSVLEPVFKVFKQKTLLEDAMLIYRIHRAPERRIFKIDTGTLPPDKARQYIERMRYEIQQKRIPNKDGGGQNVVDASYNPMSTLEDYFFAVGADGRGSTVDTLPGGAGLNEINDMLYFSNKMFRALGIPSSYMPTGPDDGSAASSDGKVGSAFIQEHRFTEKCKRHQRQLASTFDHEFKMYLKHKGIDIDSSIFDLKFSDPQNFTEYRQLEIDGVRATLFASMAEVPYIAKQTLLSRYLGWTNEEIMKNESYWKQENGVKLPSDKDASQSGLSQVGLSSNTFNPDSDLDMGEADTEGGEDMDMEDVSSEPVSDEEIDDFGQ